GTAEQRRKWLPRLAEDTVGAYALSEAGAGSDAFALVTRAEVRGDGYLLSGRKLWISNAKEAGVFIVFATVDPTVGYKGITAFIVGHDNTGLTLGRKEDKLGIRASSTCEVILDDCAVPADQVLGEAGKGYRIAIETLNEGRIGIGAQMLGLAEGALAHAVRRAKGFPQGSRDVQARRLAHSGTGGEPRHGGVRRRGVCEGGAGGEALSRRQDRVDLRGYFVHAIGDNRQEPAGWEMKRRQPS